MSSVEEFALKFQTNPEPTNSGETCDYVANEVEYSDEEGECEWANLPSVPLQSIYRHLKRKEQTNMSLVCKNWLRDFGSPGNWRKIKFYFPERSYREETVPVVRFARRYGHMIRHLEVISRRVTSGMLAICAEQFENFVKAIHRKSRLHTLVIVNLKTYLRWLNEEFREKVLEDINLLLRSQHCLRYLEFLGCEFRRYEAMAVLEAAFLEGNSPIRKIRLRKLVYENDFDEDEDEKHDEEQIKNRQRWVLACLERIEEWESDYNFLVEDLVVQFASMVEREQYLNLPRKGPLRKMILHAEGWIPRTVNGISSNHWKIFHSCFPNLQVDFVIGENNDPDSALRFFLPKRIPLHRLDFRMLSSHLPEETLSTKSFFDYLLSGSFNEILRDLRMIWRSPALNLLLELDTFARSCTKLLTVELHVSYPLLHLEQFFESWVQERPKGIQTVSISVSNIPSEDIYAQIYAVADNYVPILQVLGITFILILELTEF